MITESQYRPPVLMIRMKGHEKSEEYAEISRKTWEDRGYNVTYMDAIMDYCYKNQLEVESAAKLVNQKIKKQLKEEATKLNFIKDEEHI